MRLRWRLVLNGFGCCLAGWEREELSNRESLPGDIMTGDTGPSFHSCSEDTRDGKVGLVFSTFPPRVPLTSCPLVINGLLIISSHRPLK